MASTSTTNRKPTHDICHVRGEGKNAYWTRIGAAWLHEDGRGLNLSLEFVPVASDGRLVVRIRKETDTAQGEGAR